MKGPVRFRVGGVSIRKPKHIATMKKLFFFALAACALAACSDDDDNAVVTKTLDFESAGLGDEGYLWGKSLATEQDDVDWQGNPIRTNLFAGVLYTEEDASVKSYFNDYGGTYDTWYGFIVSNHTDRTTPGYANDKSVYAEGGAGGSKNFAVGYYDSYDSAKGAGIPTIEFGSAVKPVSVALANTTYFYLWFEGTSAAEVVDAYVIVTGWNNGTKTGEVRVQMADAATDKVESGWKSVSLEALGSVTSLTFATENDDPSGFVPNYFALDNLTYRK